ncbi:hypothetical protein ACHAXA_008768 [Cyclostephanos tholiformis]|uniref:Uncharacterized protein n=1 Tax=Cyclostephanos tholiformis TaxID=382380 RepID=A0ABD3RD50_9STRA
MVNVDAVTRREGQGPTPPSSPLSSSSSSSRSILPPITTLFVWDFDWTIVNCNSDEYVPSHFLGDAETESRLRDMIIARGHERWHECVSDLVNDCVAEFGLTLYDVLDAASSMPYLTDVRGAIEDVGRDITCGQAIISDGNDSFIGAFLTKNGMDAYFTHGVMTNMGRWDDNDQYVDEKVDEAVIGGGGGDAGDNTRVTSGKGKHVFRVVHQSSIYGGHTSAHCPPNLCKSQVLLDILDRTTETTNTTTKTTTSTRKGRPRVVYVGDGSNDACPALHVLNERDVLLARDGRRICNPNSMMGVQLDEEDDSALTGDEFGILPTIERRKKKEGARHPRCRVQTWNSGRQLRSLVRDILNEASS